MTVTTMNPPGTFAWIELGTTDGPGAKEFYTKLFGWDVKEAPMGPEFTYYMFQVGGLDVAAMRGHRVLRPCKRDRQRADREQREQRGHVAAPRAPRDAGQHAHGGIADRIAPAPALDPPVGHDRERDQREPDQREGLAEAHLRMRSSPCARSIRGITTRSSTPSSTLSASTPSASAS